MLPINRAGREWTKLTLSTFNCAEAAAAEQAQAVRELKEGKGLDNDSPEVQAAVEELLKRKAAVEEMK